MSYAVPVKWNGKVTGVIFKVQDGNNLSDITNKITFGASGRAYMMNGKGTVIANYDKELVIKMDNIFDDSAKDSALKDMADVERKMLKGTVGYGHYDYKEQSNT